MFLYIFVWLAVKIFALQLRLWVFVARHVIVAVTWPLRRLGRVLRHGWVRHLVAWLFLPLVAGATVAAWVTRESTIGDATWRLAWIIGAVAIVAPNLAVGAWLGVKAVALSVADASVFLWRGATERCPVHHTSHHLGLGAGRFVQTEHGDSVELCDDMSCDKCLVEAAYGIPLKIGVVRRARLSHIRHAHQENVTAPTAFTPTPLVQA